MTTTNPFKTLLKNEGLVYKRILGTSSTKTIKGEKLGYLTAIVYLTPDGDICPLAKSAGCLVPCLNSAGRGAFNSVQAARLSKTLFFKNNNRAYMLSLCADIWTMANKAQKLKMQLLIRLNGTSDIAYENIIVLDGKNVFQLFPEIQFYDYTKHPSRKLANKTFNNYDLTYSYSGITPDSITLKGIQNPDNSRVAVVFMRKEDIPASFRGWDVIDGDDTDVRHIEPKTVVVGLYAKGKAKHDMSGFTQIKGVHYA
jgi:hypothetical protein